METIAYVEPQPLSLLWPDGVVPAHGAFQQCDESTIEDLDLDDLARALAPKADQLEGLKTILMTLVADPAIITYRHEVLDDLLNSPALVTCFQNLLPQLGEISRLSGPQRQAQTPLQQVLWRLGELEMYVECIKQLQQALVTTEGFRSKGILALQRWIQETSASESFRSLAEELPAMRKQVAGIKSLTIGINLDAQLRPIGAMLLDIRDEEFVDRTLLDKLLKRQSEHQGIAVMHAMPPAPRNLPGRAAFSGMSGENSQPLMHPLFRDVNTVMMHAARPVADALQRYLQTNARALVVLEHELVFYLGAVRLVNKVRSWGLPMCKPEIAARVERTCQLSGNYNLSLVLRLGDRGQSANLAQEIVCNDVDFNDSGRIFILTGPNRGGKTTYTQAVGQTQVLAQAGLFVPATSASLSPVEGVFTHFPAAEKATQERGRLGEEAKRLSAIFSQATRYSLVLLNESLFSTSPGESLYLARDVVAALRLLGVRGIYATHLHELAENLDGLNAMPGVSTVVSLVAGVAEDDDETSARSTYLIQPGPPRGRSYARAIAARYGISYEKLTEALRQRGHLGD
ncbi:MAG: MutS-related protein [Anaerolineae bacterium]